MNETLAESERFNEPEPWRLQILNRGSAAMGAFFAVWIVLNARQPLMEDFPLAAAALYAGTLATFVTAVWRSGPYRVRVFLVMLTLLGIETLGLFRVGYVMGTIMAPLLAVVTGGLLLGVRWAVGCWAVSTLIFLVGGVLIGTGVVPSSFDTATVDPGNLVVGLRFAVAYAAFAAFLAIGVSVVVSRLSVSLREAERAQAGLRSSESRWRSLVENAPDYILILDRRHHLEFRNRPALGFEPEVAMAMPFEDFLLPEYREPARIAIDSVFTTAENASLDIEADTQAGERRRFRIRLSPVLREGAVDRVTLIGTDVTEQHDLERQLRQAQKMEAVGQLAGGVAHDFNNLLLVILGYAELVLKRVKSDPEAYQDVEMIQGAATRATTLTRQLLTFSRQEAARPEVLDLNERVHEMKQMLIRLIGEETELRLELATQLGRVHANPGQVEQIIANLVLNARDAMPMGGPITIATREMRLEGSDAAGLRVEPGDYVVLSVRDEGIGMSREVQARIFDPFYTTKEVGRGTGLGLSTVYGIVEQSGGAIRVESKVAEGTRFDILLPRSEHDAEARAPEPAALEWREAGSRTLLIVEDEASIRRLVRRVLEREGYEVLEAEHGREALELVNAHDGPIDMVLSDVRMPEMGGFALATELRRTHPKLRVLFMSGYPRAEAITDDGLLLDVNLIPKPFTPRELIDKLRQIFNRDLEPL